MVHRRMMPAGQQRQYGVLVGRVRDGRDPEAGDPSPHYEIWVDAGGANFRIAVNVRSVDGSDVLAFFDPNFAKPTKRDLASLAAQPGLKLLKTGPGGEGLDYLRDGLFPLDQMKDVPPEGSGVSLAQPPRRAGRTSEGGRGGRRNCFRRILHRSGRRSNLWLLARKGRSRHPYDAGKQRVFRLRQSGQWRRSALLPLSRGRDGGAVRALHHAIA